MDQNQTPHVCLHGKVEPLMMASLNASQEKNEELDDEYPYHTTDPQGLQGNKTI